ncbi:hypothetical protein ACJ73_08419 [Blastomyces percursus]|uniref:Uncharacterized protein n=1 Tax=Blastomyces percursus TaxID=1658174 RepID=A0A1J9QVL7_9EURO|nr:hypothetical protein ACJ73_08419 [Blastomyces percursus]
MAATKALVRISWSATLQEFDTRFPYSLSFQVPLGVETTEFSVHEDFREATIAASTRQPAYEQPCVLSPPYAKPETAHETNTSGLRSQRRLPKLASPSGPRDGARKPNDGPIIIILLPGAFLEPFDSFLAPSASRPKLFNSKMLACMPVSNSKKVDRQ